MCILLFLKITISMVRDYIGNICNSYLVVYIKMMERIKNNIFILFSIKKKTYTHLHKINKTKKYQHIDTH